MMMRRKSNPTNHGSFISLALIMMTFMALAPCADAYQQQSPSRPQRQSGLTPEKKRSLSNYGPEDVFPGETSDRQQQDRTPQRQTQSRRSSRSAASAPTPAPTATPLPVLSSTPEPDPTVQLPAGQTQTGSLPAAQAPPDWLLPVLGALTLLVLTALLYTVYKLYEKLRRSSR